jgi:hypothetical protein
MSIATMRPAPAATAPSSAESPTPPSPTMPTDWPGETLQVFTIIPTPVITAQPNSAAWVREIASVIFTIERREITAYSEKAETPL